MDTAGPSIPCPCGRAVCRGRYQAGGVPALAPIRAFTAEQRRSALEKLQEFVCFAPWRQTVERDAREVFWGLQGGDPALSMLDEAVGAVSRHVYSAWFFFDLRLGDLQVGDERRVAEHFLAERATWLSPGERAYLEAALATCMRLYEIVEAPGCGAVVLADVLDGQRATVSSVLEPGAAVEQGDLLAARVMPCGVSGQPHIDGVPLAIHRSLRGPLVDVLRRARESFDAACPGAGEARFFETVPPLIHHVWLQPTLYPAIPQLVVAP